jgi:hypothetical protein
MNNQVIQKLVNSYESFIKSEVYGDNRPSPWTQADRARICACACLLPDNDKYSTPIDRIKYTVGIINRIKVSKGLRYNAAISYLETVQADDSNSLDKLIIDKPGQVMSLLYDNWYKYNNDQAIMENSIYQDQVITEFFKSYVVGMSPTVRARIQELVRIKGIKGVHGALLQVFYRIYKLFPHKHVISKTEFFILLCKYIPRIYTKKSKGK